MKDEVSSLLEDDHQSLSELLVKLKRELAVPNLKHAFELLDVFWARLAVHIRAENLQLFPALVNFADDSSKSERDLPSPAEVQNTLASLHADHDFFMKELGRMIKSMRTMVIEQSAPAAEVQQLQDRLVLLDERLENHNRLEEEHAYTWPALIFDKQKLEELSDHLRHELQNLPPRLDRNSSLASNRQAHETKN